ncbi:MAG TPA: hypothetical protein VFB54_04955 [Burkholderiales bacterium]|nr:hypothetical protein [Burkholderiales bacterium]
MNGQEGTRKNGLRGADGYSQPVVIQSEKSPDSIGSSEKPSRRVVVGEAFSQPRQKRRTTIEHDLLALDPLTAAPVADALQPYERVSFDLFHLV